MISLGRETLQFGSRNTDLYAKIHTILCKNIAIVNSIL